MSSREGGGRESDTWIGYKTFDLSEARDKELVQMPTATAIAPVNVDGEAYFRFGQENAPPIPLQELNNLDFEGPIQQVYMDNPAGSAGDTLDVIIGRGGSLDVEQADESAVEITSWSAGTLNVVTPNTAGINTDSLTGDGSFGSQAIPDGFALSVKAESGNGDTAFVDGYPLTAGEETPPLHVTNFDVPAITFGTQTDTVHGIAVAP